MNKEDIVDALKVELENFKASVPTKDEVRHLAETVIKMQAGRVDGIDPRTLIGALKDSINEKRNAINKSIETRGTEAVIVVKADVLKPSITNNTTTMRLSGVEGLQHRRLRIADLFPQVNLSQGKGGQVSYIDWDDATIVRAAAMIAEGTAFPENTAKFAQYNVPLKKLGTTIPASSEVLYDTAWMASELERFLLDDVALLEDEQLWSGDGTGNNITGLEAYTPVAYTASGLSLAKAYIPDVVVDMVTQLTTATKFEPDFVLMHGTLLSQILMVKDTTHNYVDVPFYQNGKLLGLDVVVTNTMGANELFIGQKSKATIYNDGQTDIMTGYGAGDFEEDMIRIRAKKRELLLIREMDKGAFSRCDDVTAAITALELP